MASGALSAAAPDLERIGAYLARRDPDAGSTPADALVLCGSAVLPAVEEAARLVRDGLAPVLVVTGGVGHSTSHLRAAVAGHPRYGDVPTAGRSEAAITADLLCGHLGVPRSVLVLEEEATHCGENAVLSLALLARRAVPVRSVLVVQDPTMQRRTHASFEHARSTAGVLVRSHAPFVPAVGAAGVGPPGGPVVWDPERFTSLVLGEVRRLHDDEDGYGPRGAGFIDHVDVPDDVLAAYDRLRSARPGAVRGAWRP